jgi:hypothetical protein
MARFKTAKDSIRRQKNKQKRVDLVGGAGVNRQDARERAAGEAGAAREAVKRVGEYRRGRVDPADGNNDTINRKSVERLK